MCPDPDTGGIGNGIDPCIANEILRLNLAGCQTWSSCCGHGKHAPFVLIVGAHSAWRATELGYTPTLHHEGGRFTSYRITPRTGDHIGTPDGPRPSIRHRLTRTQRLLHAARWVRRTP